MSKEKKPNFKTENFQEFQMRNPWDLRIKTLKLMIMKKRRQYKKWKLYTYADSEKISHYKEQLEGYIDVLEKITTPMKKTGSAPL